MHMFFGIPEGNQVHALCPYGWLFQYAFKRQGRLTDAPTTRYNAPCARRPTRIAGASSIVH